MKPENLTAYALGELHGSEREAFEKELAGSQELQSELAETTSLCGALRFDPDGDLGANLRAKLLAGCRGNICESRRHRKIRKIVFATSLTALAACLLIAPMLPWTAFRLPSSGGKADDAKGTTGFVLQEQPASAPEGPVPVAQPANSALLASNDWSRPARNFSSGTPLSAEVKAVNSQPEVVGLENARVVTPTTVSLVASAGSAGLSAAQMPVMDAKREMMPSAPGSAVPVAAALTKTFTGGWGKGSGSGGDACVRMPSVQTRSGFNTESYDDIAENVFLEAKTNPLSTFSIDVDTASYSNIRRFLNDEQLPPAGAVRVEELINYFPYTYPQPENSDPFSVNVETARAPWAPEHQLVRIGIRGRELDPAKRPASNLVFLVDVSGSMRPENRLPLLKRSLRALVEKLGAKDSVAIVVYAGASGLALPPTSGSEKQRILEALDHLDAGGSTNGGKGITLAYETARENFLKDGINRVILCTDGDFNVGVTDQGSLVKLIEKERGTGVFLSVLGFGEGNLKDSMMEKLADKGNGNYAYIDSFSEGRKVLVEQMGGTLFTIAKDVKIQVEFNPARVAGYRLIGYENRLLAKEDFNDDKKDAGEIGAGHSVTALYEIVPSGKSLPGEHSVDPLKYQTPPPQDEAASDELLTLKLRYKAPDGDTSKLIETPLKATEPKDFSEATPDFQFAAAVAAFGMKLRGTPGSDDISWKDIQSAARRSLGEDPGSYRAEFLTLVEKASRLQEPR